MFTYRKPLRGIIGRVSGCEATQAAHFDKNRGLVTTALSSERSP